MPALRSASCWASNPMPACWSELVPAGTMFARLKVLRCLILKPSSPTGAEFSTVFLMPLKQPAKGKLISFEGAEGSGKSTQISRLAAHFQKTDREVISTREPGGTEIGEQIRNIIVHNSKRDEMCAH